MFEKRNTVERRASALGRKRGVSARERLAAEQTALLRALVGSTPPAEGFDAARIAAASASLARKRERSVARAWPALADELGARFHALFELYARTHALPAGGSPENDARALAWFLEARQELGPEGRLLALARDLETRTRRLGAVRAGGRLVLGARVFGHVLWLAAPQGRSVRPPDGPDLVF